MKPFGRNGTGITDLLSTKNNALNFINQDAVCIHQLNVNDIALKQHIGLNIDCEFSKPIDCDRFLHLKNHCFVGGHYINLGEHFLRFQGY